MQTVSDVRRQFIEFYGSQEHKGETLEMINASFIADEETIFGKLNEEYAQQEISWYISQGLKIHHMQGDIPRIWKNIAAYDGRINSNYGWCLFSDENGHQFIKALRALRLNKDTRQAVMIYIRPSMHDDAISGGMKDFMCTYACQLLIRDNKLYYIVNMRSNDAVFGYKNDKHWHGFIHRSCLLYLRDYYPDLEEGLMFWNVGSLHVYRRHWHLLEKGKHV